MLNNCDPKIDCRDNVLYEPTIRFHWSSKVIEQLLSSSLELLNCLLYQSSLTTLYWQIMFYFNQIPSAFVSNFYLQFN